MVRHMLLMQSEKPWLIEPSDDRRTLEVSTSTPTSGWKDTLQHPGCSYFKIIQPVNSSLRTVYGAVLHAHTVDTMPLFPLPT